MVDPPPAPTRVERYGSEPSQFVELRLPEATGPHPAIILVHGGFWRVKYGLSYFGHLAAALTAAGFATWNIEYRRVGEQGGGWPGTFRDVAAAAKHLVDHADFLGVDPLRVSVIGHSAGGHLALWLAGLHRTPMGSPFQGLAISLRGAVSLAGAIDLQATYDLHLGDDAVVELLGGTPAEVPERYAAASPAALLPLGTPQVIVQGTKDSDVPVEIADGYVAAATAAGDEVEYLRMEGVDHDEIVDPASDAWKSIAPAVFAIANR
jgi:acetyl esterase/lipase